MDVSILANILRYVTVTVILSCTVWILTRRYREHSRLPHGPPGWPLIWNLLFLLRTPTCASDGYRFSQWSRRYGDIYKIKLGPSLLMYVLSDADLVREAFSHSKIQGRLPAYSYKKAFGLRAASVGLSSGSEWVTLRRFTHNLFRDLGVGRKLFADTINSEIIRLDAKLGSYAEETCWNVTDVFKTAVGNIVCGITFGHQYDYEDDEIKEINDIMHRLAKAMGPAALVATSKFLCDLPFGPGKTLVNVMGEFERCVKIRMRETRSEPESATPPDTFVKAFMSEMGKGETHFCEETLVSSCLELFFAGTETTAITMAFAILFLTTHPRVQEKCQEELANFVEETGGMPAYHDRTRLPYVQATILETQRLNTATPIGGPHVVEEDNLKLFGYDFPKGSLVAGNFDFMNMDERKFPRPYEFRPERFIEDGHFASHPDILPFSTGRRSCPGEPLARMEIFLILTNLLHSFTFTVPAYAEMPDYRVGVYGGTRTPLPFGVDIRRREK